MENKRGFHPSACQTLTGATVAVKCSRWALLRTAGPFEPAPSTAITIRVICN